MPVKAILFDKDGTLIDFADTFFDACGAIIHQLSNGDANLAQALADAAEFDLETMSCPAGSQIVAGTSLTIAELWQPFLNRNSTNELSRELDSYFDKYTLETVTAFEFTKTALQELADMELVLGVATNDSENNARAHLKPIGIENMFSFIAGYDSGFGAKPDPGVVKEFARHCNCKTSEVIMVGDSINDLLAGKRAGAIGVAVTSGIADAVDLRDHADHVLDDISQLPKLVVSAKAL